MYCAAARENVARASVLQLSARLRRRDGKSDVMIDRSHLHYDVMCAYAGQLPVSLILRCDWSNSGIAAGARIYILQRAAVFAPDATDWRSSQRFLDLLLHLSLIHI